MLSFMTVSASCLNVIVIAMKNNIENQVRRLCFLTWAWRLEPRVSLTFLGTAFFYVLIISDQVGWSSKEVKTTFQASSGDENDVNLAFP